MNLQISMGKSTIKNELLTNLIEKNIDKRYENINKYITFVKNWRRMADDLESRISRIESKLVVMLEKYRRLEAEKEEYQRKTAELAGDVDKLTKQIEQLKLDNDYLRMARAINSSAAELSQSKAILTQLVRDVDKCIAQLTD